MAAIVGENTTLLRRSTRVSTDSKTGVPKMAQAKKPKQEHEPGDPMSPEQVGEQARALNEQIVETATKIGQDALQHYVDWLQAVADQQRTLASSPRASQMDWFASMMKAQADFTEQFAKMVGGMAPLGQQPES